MAGKKHYHVQIRRNGAVYGTFGPYAKRSDALADAGSLGAPGVKVAVVSGSGSSCPSCPGKAPAKRRNAPWWQKGRQTFIVIDGKGQESTFTGTHAAAARYAQDYGVTLYGVRGPGHGTITVIGKAPAKRRKNTSKRKVGDRVRVPQVDMRYVATVIKRGRAFPGGDVANLVEFGSGRTLWVHDDEVVYRKADNDPKPSKRRNTSVKAGSRWVLLRPISLRFGNRLHAFREGDTVYVEKVDKNGKTVHISHDGDVPGVVPLPVDGFLQIAIPSEDYYRRFYAADGTRKNTSGKWIQKATAGSKQGVFRAQATRAGYKSAIAFARAVMKRWKAGHKSVENKRTGKMQRVTVTTMRRANLALNMQGRKAPAKRNPSTSRDLPPALARK